MRKPLIIIICVFVYLSFVIPAANAAGLTLSPSFQEVTVIATESSTSFNATLSQQKETTALVTYHNQNESPLSLDFSLATITATDLFGRFQFNAPLPQTLKSVNSDSAHTQINPQSISLKPDEIATVSVTFSPQGLRPGTNAFLLLARIASSNESPLTRETGETPSELIATTINQSLGSSILVNAYGGATINLKLVKLEWSDIPIRFSLPDFLTFTLKNEGNLRAIPHGIAITTDQFGRELNRGALNEASTAILPGSQRVVYATLSPVKTPWPFMFVHLRISGYDSDHQSQFSLSKSFLYINPWFLPGAIILYLLILALKRKILR